SGFKEVLVYNLKDLEKINPEKEAIRVAHAIGKRKKSEIVKKAEEMKIKVLNP
ncbi:MAG: eL32 family ribosomal protein, partial [Candidatus Aenigmatarchaeota archaeon]